jgi:hypothetical protein
MEQPSNATGFMKDIAAIFFKWKWLLLAAAGVTLAGALAYFFIQSRREFALGIMIPEQITFSFNEKAPFELSTRSLDKHDYERMTLFFFDRDLFRRYARETAGGTQTDPGRTFDLQGLIIPEFAVDFNSAAARNETLQYLLLRSAPGRGVSLELLGGFTLNVLKNYSLLGIFNDYYNALQAANVKNLDIQRGILDALEKTSMKIAKLRERRAKETGAPAGRGDFMLQVGAENERYLELGQQLAANEILWNENKINLEMNRKKIARALFMIGVVDRLRREHLEILYRDPRLARVALTVLQRGQSDRDLDQEFRKLLSLFDLVDVHFRMFSGDPRFLKDRYLVFKAMAIFIFTFGLLLLSVLALEFRRKPGR